MPQEIPVEAAETLFFTPECFAGLGDDAPRLELRAVTSRDKRFQNRLLREEGVRAHDAKAIRQEILTGLKELWSEDQYNQHVPVLEAYWEAQDDFALQAKEDPDLVWTYDAETERACASLIERVIEAWPKLRRMIADNADFGEMVATIWTAVVVKRWTNLDVKLVRDRGYLTVDCAEALLDALDDHAQKLGIAGKPSTELFLACTRRFRIDEDEVKNSASPLPSETPQTPSIPTTEQKADGKSPASASSKTTQQTA